MGTYNTNNGRYQKRANYYTELTINNQYRHVYQDVVTIYTEFYMQGMEFFKQYDHKFLTGQSDWRRVLYQIRDLEGLGHSWGFALKIIDLVDTEKVSSLASALETLMDSLLEVLPAYLPWTPTATLKENQPIVDFLQDRGNEYRAVGNPKFYAYDCVVNSIASITIPVTGINCVYVNGVGSQITRHIRNFLSRPSPEIPN